MALKNFKPMTPGQRGLVLTEKSELFKGKPIKSLVSGLSSSGGRIIMDILRLEEKVEDINESIE